MILLINPPLVKPSEPPPGIARLYGALSGAGVKCSVIDANIEGILHLLGKSQPDSDNWTKRADRNRAQNLDLVRSDQGYRDSGRYKRAVSDLNRLIAKSGKAVLMCGSASPTTGITSFPRSDPRTFCGRRKEFEKNPFYEYFSKRISHALELHSPDVVGISLNYLSQAMTAFSIIGYIRARYGKVRIVLGGSLITSWMRNPRWTNPFSGLVDRIVDGPGEAALLELAG